MAEILVLGAGMVGTSTALELALRGHAVTLLDRRPPGRETSYGNAGVIQREAVEPYAVSRSARFLLSLALRKGVAVSWQAGGLLAAWRALAGYWRASEPATHRRIGREYAGLIAHATSEHQRFIELAAAGDLVHRKGIRILYRSQAAFDSGVAEAGRLSSDYGIAFEALSTPALAAAEPALRARLAGAVHWLDAWSVDDPGALVERYAAVFRQRGGRFVPGDAEGLRAAGAGWKLETREGLVEAEHAVVALGPWAEPLTRGLGYRLPLFVKRGYHRHYVGGASLAVPTLDAERGYVLAPQRQGLRLTTGVEIARLDSAATPRQLAGAEAEARGLLDLGRGVESEPWLGNRPCVADMKPIIGAAPRHRGLWFNFGHGHQGFTLGPASARLLADLIEQQQPFTEAAAFSPRRFDR